MQLDSSHSGEKNKKKDNSLICHELCRRQRPDPGGSIAPACCFIIFHRRGVTRDSKVQDHHLENMTLPFFFYFFPQVCVFLEEEGVFFFCFFFSLDMCQNNNNTVKVSR